MFKLWKLKRQTKFRIQHTQGKWSWLIHFFVTKSTDSYKSVRVCLLSLIGGPIKENYGIYRHTDFTGMEWSHTICHTNCYTPQMHHSFRQQHQPTTKYVVHTEMPGQFSSNNLTWEKVDGRRSLNFSLKKYCCWNFSSKSRQGLFFSVWYLYSHQCLLCIYIAKVHVGNKCWDLFSSGFHSIFATVFNSQLPEGQFSWIYFTADNYQFFPLKWNGLLAKCMLHELSIVLEV